MAQPTVVDNARITIIPDISLQDIKKWAKEWERLFAQVLSNFKGADPLIDNLDAAGRKAGKAFSGSLTDAVTVREAISEVEKLKDKADSVLKNLADGNIDLNSQEAITELSQLQSRADELVRSIANGADIDLNSQQALTELDQLQSRINALQRGINIPPVNVPVQLPNGTQLGNQLGNQISQGVGNSAGPAGTTAGTTAGNSFGDAFLGTIATVLGGVALGAALGNALEVEGMNNKLQAQLALSADDAKEYGSIAGELYAGAYGDSMETVQASLAGVLGSISEEGGKASYEQVKKMTQDTLLLSDTYGLAQEQVTAGVQSFVNNGLGSWDQGIQLIIDGYTNMGTKGDDWIDTIREYSGDFKTMGLDAESSFEVINGLLEAGVFNTDTAADSLREFGILARTMDQGQVDALTALGLDPATVQQKALEGGDALVDAYVDVQKRLQESKDQNLYTALIGGQSEDQFNAFVNADWSNMTDNSEKVANNIDLINTNMGDGTSTALTALQRQFEITLGEIAVPLMEALLPLLQLLAIILVENKDVIAIIGPPLLILGAAVTVLVAAMTAWTVISGLFTAGMLSVVASTWAWTVALLANPVTWIVLAVIALIAALVLLVMNWDVVISFWSEKWAGFVSGLGDLWNWFVEYLVGLVDDIAFLWDRLVIFLGEAWNNFVGGVGNGISAVSDWFSSLGQGIVDIMTGAWNVVLDVIDSIMSFFSGDWLSNLMGGTFNIGFGNFSIPGMANGGTVPATPGGSLRYLGEAGRSEIVMDEGLHNKNAEVNTKLAQSVLNKQENNTSSPQVSVQVDNYNQMDGYELGDVLGKRIAWTMGV